MNQFENIKKDESKERNNRFIIIDQAHQHEDEMGEGTVTWAVNPEGILGSFQGNDAGHELFENFDEASEEDYKNYHIAYPPSPDTYEEIKKKIFGDNEKHQARQHNLSEGK